MEPHLGSDPIPEPAQPLDTPRVSGLTSTVLNRRAVAIAEILLCSSVPTQVLIGTLLRAGGLAPMEADGQLSLPFVLILSIADTVVLVLLMMFLTRSHGQSVRDLWLGSRPIGREILHGLMLVPLVFVMVVALLNVMRVLAPWLHNVPVNPLEQLAATPGQAAVFAVVAILAGGVREELQRAFLLKRFEDHLGGAIVGVIVLSLAFGLGHIVQGWDAVITTGALGAFWAVVYLRRRSAVAPLVSHSGFNALEVMRVAVMGV
jgi:membrane protease YdiL (CAAX protease family)